MRTLNLGILAHVDAGKTTLSERLLYTAGAIDHVGSVDAGTTQTDSLELERERGITIRSAVASFLVGDLAVNLVDTPGHPDFIAEVERVLGVLDGAVLVVSAVEGVQPQTPLLFRALQRLHVPTLIFVNKIDRAGADPDRVIAEMRRRLSSGVIAIEAASEPDPTALIEVLAEHDERILDAYVTGGMSLTNAQLRASLAQQTKAGHVHPVFVGSAGRGVGIAELLAGIDELLVGERGDPEAPVSGRVFKIERTSSGERVAYVRLFAGTLRAAAARSGRRRGRGEGDLDPGLRAQRAPRDGTPSRQERWRPSEGSARSAWVTRSANHRPARPSPRASRGRRSRPWCSPARPSSRARSARPSPSSPSRTRSSTSARTTPGTRSRSRCTARSRRRSSRPRSSASTASRRTSARRRPSASSARLRVGEAEEVISAKTHTNITGRSSPLSTNPFMATLALRIEPAAVGSGIEFRAEVEPRLVPLYLFRTPDVFATQMEAFVREALGEGLAGWQVTDCLVTMTDCGYASPVTSAADFRRLTQLVLMTALDRAGTWVCEPLADLSLEMPAATAQGVLAALGRLGGRVRGQFSANGLSRVQAVLPVGRVRSLQHQLPGLSMGEGILESRPDGYQPIGDNPPKRPRSGPSPLDRDAWLASLAKRG